MNRSTNGQAGEIEAGEEGAPAASRRRFLTRGAAAAAAAAAAGVVMSSPAGAANGDTLFIGTNNSGTATTQLTGSRFTVTNGNGSISIVGQHTGANSIGVLGTGGNSANAGTGVVGRSQLATGVKGEGITGVHGTGGGSTIRGIGVRGTSQTGPQLKLDTEGNGPPGGGWTRGEFFAGANGLFYATQTGSGAAAGWVKLSGVLQPLDSPIRAYDSRVGQLPATGPKTPITAGVNRNIDLTGTGLLPATAQAALVNITVTNTSAQGGFLKVFKAGAAVPIASNINWSGTGQTIANSTLVGLNASGLVTVRCGGTAAQTDFIIDILAYAL